MGVVLVVTYYLLESKPQLPSSLHSRLTKVEVVVLGVTSDQDQENGVDDGYDMISI